MERILFPSKLHAQIHNMYKCYFVIRPSKIFFKQILIVVLYVSTEIQL